MRIVFNVEYFTEFGQQICVLGSIPELGSWDETRPARMDYIDNGKWRLEIFIDDEKVKTIQYKYILTDDRNQFIFHEWGEPRSLPENSQNFLGIHVIDSWRETIHDENPLFSAAFTKNLWRRKKKRSQKTTGHFNHTFRLNAPRIDEDHVFCLIGNEEGIGNWDPHRAVMMDDRDYPVWKADVFLEGNQPVSYKYGVYDKKNKKLISWEAGGNRTFEHNVSVIENNLVIKTDERYRYPQGMWKGAGVAIPVFSVRTKSSFGVGEFPDLKKMVDWAVQVNHKLIQILPINDTIAEHSWADSYPYAAISVFALHPIYLNLPTMGKLKDKKEMDRFVKEGKKLNENPDLDYQAVMELKSPYFKKLYDQEKKSFLVDPEYKKFFKENRNWLENYAAFSYLRDKFKTADFSQWKEYSSYEKPKIDKLVDPSNKIFDDIAVHYFIQYHLHKQLSEVVEYAREKGVVLKGDLPIGIYRNSVDAWVAPQLYYMDKQAGAPPDAYSITGQNWKFPTYNWDEMARDDYAWWKQRLTQMAKYFDAYRIDHILGFFRIWEIPWDSLEGLMGIFNPAIPMYKNEIEGRGIHFDYDRFCRPYIREYMLDELFGEWKEEVKEKYLNSAHNDFYELKSEFDTQRKVQEHFDSEKSAKKSEDEKSDHIRYGLFTLLGNVLFFDDPNSPGEAFHPKIAFHQTYSYRELDDHTKNIMNEVYTHYYYHRQEDFWRGQAMVKLPAINKASNMLICGEDLGMVPDCVPGVMRELSILRLYIERMSKEPEAEFGHPYRAPYLSVVSPSSHDMSTIRGWWEEDRERSQRYFEQVLGHHGQSPYYCEPWLCEAIILQHFNSPAMWAITPIQDLVAMDDSLKRENPNEERINDPSNPNNLWKFRFHINMEDLMKERNFNRKLADMVEMTGRNREF